MSPQRFARAIALVGLLMLCGLPEQALADNPCKREGVSLQVLGSGGSDLAGGRAGASYLVWVDRKARVLINVGAGSVTRFISNEADFSDLDLILLNNLHVDTWADLPALLRTAYYSNRKDNLPILAPPGNDLMAGPRAWLGFWEQLKLNQIYPAELLASATQPILPLIPFHLELKTPPKTHQIWSGFYSERLSVRSIPVNFGNIPALAWLVKAGEITILFAGNLSGSTEQLLKLGDSIHTLVMHFGIGEGKRGLLKKVYTEPSAIARAANRLGAKSLLLGHRMGRTLGLEQQTFQIIKRDYQGSILFAEDDRCLYLQSQN